MCGSKGGGSPPVPNASSTAFQSTTVPSPSVSPTYQNFLNTATQLAQTPFNPAMQGQVAPLTGTETAAGTQLFNLGMNLGNFDPSKVQSIESPYIQDVVQATQNWFNNQNAIQGSNLMSNAIRTGNAFGGDRAGIAEAQLAGQQQLAQAPVISGLYQSGYTQALDEYNRLQQMGMQGAQAALGWGGLQQQQAQRELDVAQQNAMMASAYPFQTANWYGSVLGGIGPLLGSQVSGYNTPPAPNALGQTIGLASAGLGLASAGFGKRGGDVDHMERGGLVQIPRYGDTYMARGGLVYVADGGDIDSPDATVYNDTGDRREARDALALARHVRNSEDQYDQPEEPRARRSVPNLTGGSLRLPSQTLPQPTFPQMPSGTTQPQQSDQTAQLLTSGAGLAMKLAPLLLLRRGGPVLRFARGGSKDGPYNIFDLPNIYGQLQLPARNLPQPSFPSGGTPAAPQTNTQAITSGIQSLTSAFKGKGSGSSSSDGEPLRVGESVDVPAAWRGGYFADGGDTDEEEHEEAGPPKQADEGPEEPGRERPKGGSRELPGAPPPMTITGPPGRLPPSPDAPPPMRITSQGPSLPPPLPRPRPATEPVATEPPSPSRTNAERYAAPPLPPREALPAAPSDRPTAPPPTQRPLPPTPQQPPWRGETLGPYGRAQRGAGQDFYSRALRAVQNSNLVGRVPRDGAAFGIRTGSAEEWANFMTRTAKLESNFNPRSRNLTDPGGSFGVLQYAHGQVPGGNAYNTDASIQAFIRDAGSGPSLRSNVLGRRFSTIGFHKGPKAFADGAGGAYSGPAITEGGAPDEGPGDGGGGRARPLGPGESRVIPGYGAPPPTYFQRLASNPLWNFGANLLAQRSPYLGVNVGTAMQQTSMLSREERNRVLDEKPKQIELPSGEIGFLFPDGRITNLGLGVPEGKRLTQELQKQKLATPHDVTTEEPGPFGTTKTTKKPYVYDPDSGKMVPMSPQKAAEQVLPPPPAAPPAQEQPPAATPPAQRAPVRQTEAETAPPPAAPVPPTAGAGTPPTPPTPPAPPAAGTPVPPTAPQQTAEAGAPLPGSLEERTVNNWKTGKILPIGTVTNPKALPPRDEAYLATMNPEEQINIKAIANYEADLNKLYAGKNANQRSHALAAVKKYDPSYDQRLYPARSRALIEYGVSGASAKNLQSNDMVLSHIGDAMTAVEGLKNSTWPMYNKVTGEWQMATGNTGYQAARSAFDTAMNGVATEAAKTFRGVGSMSQEEQRLWREIAANKYASPVVLRGALKQLTTLVLGRTNAIANQHNTAMGPAYERDGETFIGDKAKETVARSNAIDPERPIPPSVYAPEPPPKPAGGPQTAPQPQVSPQDKEALDWANANPNDPRAAKIKQRLGVQ